MQIRLFFKVHNCGNQKAKSYKIKQELGYHLTIGILKSQAILMMILISMWLMISTTTAKIKIWRLEGVVSASMTLMTMSWRIWGLVIQGGTISQQTDPTMMIGLLQDRLHPVKSRHVFHSHLLLYLCLFVEFVNYQEWSPLIISYLHVVALGPYDMYTITACS